MEEQPLLPQEYFRRRFIWAKYNNKNINIYGKHVFSDNLVSGVDDMPKRSYAINNGEAFTIGDGIAVVGAGDVVIRDSNGDYSVMTRENFDKMYEEAPHYRGDPGSVMLEQSPKHIAIYDGPPAKMETSPGEFVNIERGDLVETDGEHRKYSIIGKGLAERLFDYNELKHKEIRRRRDLWPIHGSQDDSVRIFKGKYPGRLQDFHSYMYRKYGEEIFYDRSAAAAAFVDELGKYKEVQDRLGEPVLNHLDYVLSQLRTGNYDISLPDFCCVPELLDAGMKEVDGDMYWVTGDENPDVTVRDILVANDIYPKNIDEARRNAHEFFYWEKFVDSEREKIKSFNSPPDLMDITRGNNGENISFERQRGAFLFMKENGFEFDPLLGIFPKARDEEIYDFDTEGCSRPLFIPTRYDMGMFVRKMESMPESDVTEALSWRSDDGRTLLERMVGSGIVGLVPEACLMEQPLEVWMSSMPGGKTVFEYAENKGMLPSDTAEKIRGNIAAHSFGCSALSSRNRANAENSPDFSSFPSM